MAKFMQAYHQMKKEKKLRKKRAIQQGSWTHPIGQSVRHVHLLYNEVHQISNTYPQYGKQNAYNIMNSKQQNVQTPFTHSQKPLKQIISDMDTVHLVIYTIAIIIILAIIVWGAILSYS